jgi:hypothetical protein
MDTLDHPDQMRLIGIHVLARAGGLDDLLPASRRDEGGAGLGLGVAGSPGGLAAGGRAVGLAADRGERLPAGGALTMSRRLTARWSEPLRKMTSARSASSRASWYRPFS